MKQFLLFILAGCIVLFSGCRSDISPTEGLETEPTFMDAAWQKATDAPQTKETFAETEPATEERSDELSPTQIVCEESTETVTESSKEQMDQKPPATEQPAPTTSKNEAAIPSTEATTSETTIPTQTVPPATEPPATEPAPTIPAETEPIVAEPPVTEPPATVPPETAPEAEVIDTAALESYGRSYASSAYGYNGTSACHGGTGAGYFPAATKKITSMEEGYNIVQQAIDSQYKRDCAYGYTPYEEVDGVTVRCPINISVEAVGDNTYTITVYYGGTA